MKKILFSLALVLTISLAGCTTESITCGTGTTLEDEVCVADEVDPVTCGTGSTLTENECVVDEVEAVVDYSGTYVGYSWKGEAGGTLLADASQKIETTLVLDEDGMIVDATVLFWKMSDGSWYTRQDGTANISADLSVVPMAATPGSEYVKGTSMFTVDTHDFMSLYSVVVAADGSAGFLLVDPSTRYQFEIALPSDYDYSTLVGDVTVNGTAGGFIPTVRTSGSGLLKPAAWTELDAKNIFNITGFNHVMSDYGMFDGVTEMSTMQELLEAAGVMFTMGTPDEHMLSYGRHSAGGWQGNYEAIEEFLIGKNAMDLDSLVDWDVERWGDAVNEDNFFGIDVPAGATKSAQDSFDTIAGATVRMSRESTSFQRALVEAGILTEEDVVKGRF